MSGRNAAWTPRMADFGFCDTLNEELTILPSELHQDRGGSVAS